MSDYDLLDDAVEAIESDFEFDEDLESLLEDDERSRVVRRRPVTTGRGAGYYKPRVQNRFVTQAQLQGALGKISKDVRANAAGLKVVGGRVDTVATEQRRQTDLLKKEIGARRKEIDKLKSNLQLGSLLPLLTSKTVTLTEQVGNVPSGTKLSVAPDGLTTMLPLLLMGDGLGGGGGDSSNMLLLVLALSGGLGGR